MRVLVRRAVDDRLGVEQDEIGVVALPDRAAFDDPQVFGGERGHLADALLEADDVAFANVVAEGNRVKAPNPRGWEPSRSPSLQMTVCGQAMIASMSGSSMAKPIMSDSLPISVSALSRPHQSRFDVGAADFRDLGERQAVVGRFRQEVGQEDVVGREQVAEDVLGARPAGRGRGRGTRVVSQVKDVLQAR